MADGGGVSTLPTDIVLRVAEECQADGGFSLFCFALTCRQCYEEIKKFGTSTSIWPPRVKAGKVLQNVGIMRWAVQELQYPIQHPCNAKVLFDTV